MNKKLFTILLTAMMLCTLSVSAQTRGVIKRTNDGWVGLRTGPGTNYSLIRTLHAGDIVYYSSVGNGWSRVKYSPNGQWVGYVATRLIQRSSGSTSRSYSGYTQSGRRYGVIKRTNDGGVGLRSGPGTNYTLLRRLHAGDVVYYSNQGNGWARVSYTPNGQWVGWVAIRLIN